MKYHCRLYVFLVTVLVFCLFSDMIFARNDSIKTSNNTGNDTVSEQKDIETYNRMHKAMSGRKLSKRLFSMLTTRPRIEPPAEEHSIDQQFMPFKNKIISNISVKVLSPFGYNVRSDSLGKINIFEKIGNSFHSNTRNWVLRNNLLFKKGEQIDPVVIAETESILRALDYVNDVFISIDSLPDNSAEIKIYVKDNFSTGVYPRNVSTVVDMEIFDNNLFGLGNNVGLRGIYDMQLGGATGYGASYRYTNFLRTFVSINASYVDDIASRNQNYAIERPLQQSLNFFGQTSYRKMERNPQPIQYDSLSLTGDMEFSISSGYAFNRLSDKNIFVVSARCFDRKPQYGNNNYPAHQFVENTMGIMQLALFRQRYFRDRLINSFGKPENFAYGYNVSMQIGYSKWRQFSKEGLYLSARTAFNKRLDAGSFYFEGALSSFLYAGKTFEGLLQLRMKAFSRLYVAPRNLYRFFLNIDYTKRLNPVQGLGSYLTPSEFASMSLRNTDYAAVERLMLQTEADMFSSLNILGFRFLFYTFGDLGWLAEDGQTLLNRNNIFCGIGLGIRIRNDLLVLRTIELKCGYYPQINQRGFNDYVHFRSSIPNKSPSFIPRYPERL